MSASATSEAIIWHDVENGAYDADLDLWRELAAAADGPTLDVGCGTGRVALDLARRGHRVHGVDIEAAFVEALRERAEARGLEVTAQTGDIRDLCVSAEFSLIIVPMQTIQLLDGPDERQAALTSMRALLAPRGSIALAIVTGDLGAARKDIDLGPPLPDVAEIDGWIYSSLPVELRAEDGRLVVTRLRQIVAPGGGLGEERDEVRLAILDPDLLASEAPSAGLRLASRRHIPPTAAHVGSSVVLLEATR